MIAEKFLKRIRLQIFEETRAFHFHNIAKHGVCFKLKTNARCEFSERKDFVKAAKCKYKYCWCSECVSYAKFEENNDIPRSIAGKAIVKWVKQADIFRSSRGTPLGNCADYLFRVVKNDVKFRSSFIYSI